MSKTKKYAERRNRLITFRWHPNDSKRKAPGVQEDSHNQPSADMNRKARRMLASIERRGHAAD